MFLSPNLITRLHEQSLVQRLIKDKVLLIDSSEFSYWSGCFVKGIYYGGLRRSSSQNQSALLFGSALHKGLAAYLLGESPDASIAAVRTQATLDKLDELMDPKRTTNKACEMMESYIHHCVITGRKIVPIELSGHKMVEQSFGFPLGEVDTNLGMIQVVWSGVMDVLEHYNNAIWVLDHKTTSMMGEKFVDDKVRSNQVAGYVWAARRMLAGLDRRVEGARINALCHRLKDYEFKTFEIPLHQWKIDEWQAETLVACKSIVDNVATVLTAKAPLVPNRECCVTKYGKCAYFDVCDAHENLRERMLLDNGFFKDNDWNPTGAE